jgi:hypothetical protein
MIKIKELHWPDPKAEPNVDKVVAKDATGFNKAAF